MNEFYNNFYNNYKFYNNYTKRQKGQVILLLILVMTVALAIGLSIVQKSLVDVSTASKVEQSSRAFSAAEAGIEKALQGDSSPLANFTESASITEITGTEESPCVPGELLCLQTSGQQVALEYPVLAKEDVVQVWLADYKSPLNPPALFYDPQPPFERTLDVFWGNSATDKAALELTLVYHDGAKYTSKKWYLDNGNELRPNGFEKVSTCLGNYPPFGSSNNYQCRRRLGVLPDTALPSGLMLIRARLLYNSAPQPFAVGATGSCGRACSLPPQARSITSTGVSGETQRKVKLFQLYNVVPPYFDYAIFSAGPIIK